MTTTKTDAQTVLEETAGQMLQRLGMDGMLWSIEMHKRFPQIAQDDLLGWCCNMIMAGYDEANRRAAQRLVDGEKGNTKADDPFADFCYQCDQ